MQNEDFEVEGLDVESFDVEGLGEYEELRVLDRAEPIAYVARHDRHRLTYDEHLAELERLADFQVQLRRTLEAIDPSISTWVDAPSEGALITPTSPPPLPEPLAPSPAHGSPDRHRGIVLPIWTWTMIGRLLIAAIIGLVIFGV